MVVWIYRKSGILSSFWPDGTCSEKLLDPFTIIIITGFDFI